MNNTKVTISIAIESTDMEDELTKLENERMARALEYGITNMASIEELAAMCCQSISTFKRTFRDRHSMSPRQWLLKHKLELAHRVIEEKELPIKELATICGFKNISHFIRLFRVRYGISPAKLSKQYHDKDRCAKNDANTATIASEKTEE